MAKVPVIEESQMRHAMKVAAVTGQTPERDVALLCVLYGTVMTATELAQLEVADVLDEAGVLRIESAGRPVIAFNGRRRPVYWTNPRVRETLDAYFSQRLGVGYGVTAWRSRWRGLVELGPVFLTNDGRPRQRERHAANWRRQHHQVMREPDPSHPQASRTSWDRGGRRYVGASDIRCATSSTRLRPSSHP